MAVSALCLTRPSTVSNVSLCLRVGKLEGRFALLTVNNHDEHKPPPAGLALIRPSDVAVRLGVSRSWLYEAAKTGRIPSIRIGGDEGPLRFVPADIQEWIDDARAAWTPGRPTIPTRHPTAPTRRVRRRRPRSAAAPVSGQQTLL